MSVPTYQGLRDLFVVLHCTMTAEKHSEDPERLQAPLPQINLRPDRRAPYAVVAKVLASAQRNGMTNIGFANTAEFR